MEYCELVALYPELRVTIPYTVVMSVGFSSDSIYVNDRQSLSSKNRYIKFSPSGKDVYLTLRKRDITFSIPHALGDLLHDSEYDRYFVVENKK